MGQVLHVPARLREVLASHGLNPTDLVLYINSACNLRCRHCYVGNDLLSAATRYDAGDINRFVNSFGDLNRVTVLGGEPLLHREINSIVTNICDKGVKSFRIATNLTLTGAFRSDLHRGRALTLCVSLDGHSAAIHDAIRGHGSFAKTTANIRSFLREGFEVEITHTIMSANIATFEDMLEFCRDLGVKRVNLHCMSLHGNAIRNAQLRVPPADWVRFREQLVVRSGDAKTVHTDRIAVRYPVLFVTWDQYEQLVSSGDYHHHALGSYYGRGDRVILYADGKIHVSSEAFGTEAFVGLIEDGTFRFNTNKKNELVVFRNAGARIDQMNPRQQGDDIYPAVLSVSFKKVVFV